ncbi:MAG TPA: SMI1/KNR4 family protein [Symbiobacteriaceae bacterium]
MFERFVHLLQQYAAQGSVPRRAGCRVWPSHVRTGPPANPEEIADVERRLGHPLPDDYREFLTRWNGAQIFILDKNDSYESPRIFHTQELLDPPPLLDDPRVLPIGMLDDEAFLVLDRRVQTAPQWPVYWADQLDSADKVLARPAIAGSLAEFLDRFIEAQGSWYWEPPEPLEWYKDPHTPGLWRHGLGFSFGLYEYQLSSGTRYYYRLRLPDSPYAMTAPAALIAVGLRDHLLRLGATFGVPAEFRWRPDNLEWLFGFEEPPRPKVKPCDVPPAVLSGDRWQEVAPGIWVHAPSGVCFWSRRANTHTGGPPTGRYVLTWPLHAEKAAEPLRARLRKTGMYQNEPTHLPPDYDGVEFYWWGKGNAAPAEILPTDQE